MTNEIPEGIAKQVMFDMATLKDTGLQPGEMFRIVREVENISAEVLRVPWI